jgi:hypothetical protein
MARTMHLMNSFGHVTIHWEATNDAMILPAIQWMLDHKFKFFILSEANEIPLTSITELTDRRIILPDESLQQLYELGVLQIGGVAIDDNAEVLEHDTIVTQPAQGG